MADEEVVAASSPAPSDHKRKFEDLEPEAPELPTPEPNPNSPTDLAKESAEEEKPVAIADSEAKRPRLDGKPDGLDTENGHQSEKLDEPKKEDVEEPTVEGDSKSEGAEKLDEEAPQTVQGEGHQAEDVPQPNVENPETQSADQQASAEKLDEPSVEDSQQVDASSAEQQPASGTEPTSRKMEVPNNKVGVLIGKAGDTIRYLQYNSGAKIQITRDAEADPKSSTRLVEVVGSLESINKAEKLIKDVIAEADAGGSPSLVARGFNAVQAAGAVEQLEIQVPNEKVGMIIGKGGETIKNLQTRSGARIQLIPQHLPDGDQSKDRTVRVTGDKKQIEMAREMIKDVMNQIWLFPFTWVQHCLLGVAIVILCSFSSTEESGYSHQGFRPRGPPVSSQWGPRGPHPSQPTGYDYQQRGPYPSQSQQYPPHGYGNYPQQQVPPRGSSSSFGQGWEQRSPATKGPQGDGYDYYMGHPPASNTLSNPIHARARGPSHAHAMGPNPSQANYNYGQPQAPDYGQPYSQTAPPPQGYGHGYGEPKYENQAPMQHSYGAHGGSHPGGYQQGSVQPGYGPQDQYGKPPSYGLPPQGPPTQTYGPPRGNQTGEMPYQGSMSTQTHPNVPSQQAYPYASSGTMQQTYPSYGSTPATDGYGQPQSTAATIPGYPQQTNQPVLGYGQPGQQQASAYAQPGGYGTYPTSQPVYSEQVAPNNATYGYQVSAAPPSTQVGYAQPAPTQPGYDQPTVPQVAGSYGGSFPAGYVKSVSPQPGYAQYDSAQVYGAPR